MQPREAFLTNVIGTLNILNCIKKFNLESSLFISSDKAAEPSSVLGATKLIGERMWAHSAKSSDNNHVFSVVRFGNVFLSRGSVVETFLAQLNNGEPITITDPEMTRFFMDVDEAASLITYLLDKKIPGLSVLKMGEPIAILELAERLAKFKNTKLETRIIGTKKGEKLSEILFTKSEDQLVTDQGFYLHSPFVNPIPLEKIEGLNPKSHEEAVRLIKELSFF
jgi:FlaA1/EpsC-like NDP-sugar epimerase